MNYSKINSWNDVGYISLEKCPNNDIVNLQSLKIYSNKLLNDDEVIFNDLIGSEIDDDFLHNILEFTLEKFPDYTFWWYDYHEISVFDFTNNLNFYKIYKFFVKKGLYDKIIFLDNNLLKYTLDIPYKGLPGMVGTTYNKKENINLKRTFERNLICLNRLSKPHRKEIFEYITKTCPDKCFLSFATNDKNNENFTELDTTIESNTSKRQFISQYQYLSFCNIITETSCNPKHIHITEKTDKAISAIQPFIIVAGPFYLRTLKELGFKTFDKWWDESYDLETDYNSRMSLIKNQIQKISKLSLEECQSLYKEMIPVLKHNYNLQRTYSNDYKIHLEYWNTLFFKK